MPAGDLAGGRHVHEAIHIHLRVDRQVLQVGLGDHGADGVGHAADAQLEAGPVGNLGHHQVGHGPVHVGRLAACAQLSHGGVVPLHDIGHVLDVDLGAGEAVHPGHILVDLHDNALGTGHQVGQVGGRQAEVEVAVGIHGGGLEHHHVHRGQILPVEAGQLGVAHGTEVAHALGDDLAVDAAAVPGVPGEVVAGVLRLGDLGHPHGDAAPDLYIGELILAGGESLVQGNGVVGAPGVVHPVAGSDHLDGLLGRGQLLLVHCLIIHEITSKLICICGQISR